MLVFLIILLCAILYALPGLIALGRRHPGWKRIWFINVFLGFTVLGWLWALRESLRRDAVPNHKVYYRYSYYGEETRKERFDLRQVPVSDVGVALGALAMVALAGTIAWPSVAPQPATGAAAAATVATSAKAAAGWTYSQETDPAGLVHVSTLTSDDTDATDDRIPAALILRNGSAGLSAAIRINGQFTCSSAAGGMIAAQFDGGQVEALPCAPRPNDVPRLDASGHDMLFIANPQNFIARVRAAHSLVLTASVLEQGVRNLHFSPQGLDVAQAGLPEETAVAATTAAVPAAAEVPADAGQIVAAPAVAKAAPIPSKTARRARATKPANTRPARPARRRVADHERHTVLHPFHAETRHK